jgi:hypothetical protein
MYACGSNEGNEDRTYQNQSFLGMFIAKEGRVINASICSMLD